MAITIDFAKLKLVFDKCKGRVKYKLGAKVPLGVDTNDIQRIDCSGWSRYHLHRASGVEMPDGSQVQLGWARKNLRKLASYSDVQYAKDDGSRLFIAFLSPKPGDDWPRHVWFVYMGKTMESYATGGVNSRAWNSRVLMGCKECFEVK